MPLKPCACGCGSVVVGRSSRKYLDRGHYLRSPKAKADALRASHKAKAQRDARKSGMTLSGFGRLTARELAIYERGRHNAGATQYDLGRRKGFADALGEAPEVTWRRRRKSVSAHLVAMRVAS